MIAVLALLAACSTSQAQPRRPDAAATPPPTTTKAAPPPVPQLPGGGTQLFPGRRMVALYGHPDTPGMGVLGEQGIAQSIARAKDLAADFDPVSTEPVIPAFELIATVADSVAGADGDYSAESTVADLTPWVDEAARNGVYVVLDLQPGRADFLSQAKLYAPLLARPNVGLALDPEWRLGPNQRHNVQVGTVTAAEINKTSAWLAALTKQKNLPQKVFMIHQFRAPMISDRQTLVTSHPELATVLHADGFGTPDVKMGTWNTLHTAPGPKGLWWGWKNFLDEDTPMFTPKQTVTVGPTSPVFVSYQ
ncbi:hypothetical protein [Pseudonocardia sp. KRD291]|uniref:hypothetical protein n=1 Tax=Pseudonocardia sp. KRD291 TaxID=2792007 RepID=UPI001C49D996|nr:hypothetical protein [Pseudonocardia sp. KRD291]MBW0101346.1 hypothetical protein [Pseudonocardia sp. KRD291]